MESSDHKHEDNPRAGRVCMVHDHHWDDDMAYVDDIQNDRPEGWKPPTYTDMLETLGKSEFGKGNPEIYRFTLVFTDGDGKLNILASPGSEPMEAINHLTKAASLTAFQSVEQVRMHQEMLLARIAAKLGFDPSNPDEQPIDMSDVDGGMYL